MDTRNDSALLIFSLPETPLDRIRKKEKKKKVMNEIYARRRAQMLMFNQLTRMHGTLWDATRVTKEKLDGAFVREELMRVNGRRTMPLLIPATAEQNVHQTHWNQLCDNGAWTDSMRAYSVQNQTPLTQRVAAMGRMAETITQSRTGSTVQVLFNEHIARMEGISGFEEIPTIVE